LWLVAVAPRRPGTTFQLAGFALVALG
jgi:hypothetical protein